MSEFQPGPDDLVIPFIFVPHGAPDPTDWLGRHPGAIRIPAVMVPHGSGANFSRKNLRFDMDTALDRIFGEVERSRAGPPPPQEFAGQPTQGEDQADQTANPEPQNFRFISNDDAVAAYLKATEALDRIGAGPGLSVRPTLVSSDTPAHDPPPKTQTSQEKQQSQPAEQNAEPPKTGKLIIFIGGFRDDHNKIVKYYYEDFSNNKNNPPSVYFTQNENDEIETYIKKLPQDVSVTIVGHSWGGDTAMEVVKDLPAGRVQTLITIDPVGSGGPGFLKDVAKNAKRWIDVDAVGGGLLANGNFVRGLGSLYGGGAYGRSLAGLKTSDGESTTFLVSNNAHGEFDKMMREKDPVTHETLADELKDRQN